MHPLIEYTLWRVALFGLSVGAVHTLRPATPVVVKLAVGLLLSAVLTYWLAADSRRALGSWLASRYFLRGTPAGRPDEGDGPPR